MFAERFKNRLLIQRQAGLYRHPPTITQRKGKHVFVGNRKVLNFASNDYLGLATSEELKQKVSKNFQKYGTSSSSSRLVSGNYSLIAEAEREYARYFGYEEALFFPSGYQANIAVISTLFEQSDTVLVDKHVHASSVKGLMLSRADSRGYNHNSMSHLHKRLAKANGKGVAVLTESLFSMDGDFLNVTQFAELQRRYGFFSVVDEAHAFGAIGKNGRGIARDVADIAVGTFGKALGLFGAFVLLPKGFKEYLFNFSSPLIYSTTLPEAHAASALNLLQIISRCEDERAQLLDVSSHMKEGLKRAGFKVKGDAHILAVEIGEEQTAMSLAEGLFEKGIFVFTARYPTVPAHKAILRIGMSAMHTHEDVSHFIQMLKGVYDPN